MSTTALRYGLDSCFNFASRRNSRASTWSESEATGLISVFCVFCLQRGGGIERTLQLAG